MDYAHTRWLNNEEMFIAEYNKLYQILLSLQLY